MGVSTSTGKKATVEIKSPVFEIAEIDFQTDVDISVKKDKSRKLIEHPQWKKEDKRTGRAVCWPLNSPAANKTVRVTVDMKQINRLKNVKGSVKLRGTCENITIEGDFEVAKGKCVVDCTMTAKFDQMIYLHDKPIYWQIFANEEAYYYAQMPSYHRMFFVMDEPQAPWKKSGDVNEVIWLEILECGFFQLKLNTCPKSEQIAIERITENLHNIGFRYDIVHGAASFDYVPQAGDKSFSLSKFLSHVELLKRGDAHKTLVNCYDMAGSILIFCNMIGIKNMVSRFMNPFGYINTTSLIGRGLANNPFFGSGGGDDRKISDTDIQKYEKLDIGDVDNPRWNGLKSDISCRTFFMNHLYTRHGHEADDTDRTYDACVGPCSEDNEHLYLSKAIDEEWSRILYSYYAPKYHSGKPLPDYQSDSWDSIIDDMIKNKNMVFDLTGLM